MLLANACALCSASTASIHNNVELVNLFSNCKGFIDATASHELTFRLSGPHHIVFIILVNFT